MKALLDTCVLSEIRHPKGNPAVVSTVSEFPEADIFISIISIGEIAKGIGLLGDSARSRELNSWLNGLKRGYAERILPIDVQIAELWGELSAQAQRAGNQVGAADGLIAATARAHGLHVVTRNVAHFEPMGALVLNPWDV